MPRVSETTIFKVVNAPPGPGTDTDKVAKLFPDKAILEYPGNSPVLEILGGEKEANVEKLCEAGFRIVLPAYHHPTCTTWVNP